MSFDLPANVQPDLERSATRAHFTAQVRTADRY